MHHEYMRSPTNLRMNSYREDEGIIVLIAVSEGVLPLLFDIVRVNVALL